MVIKTASPGVIVKEIDLTRGTSDAITTNVGGMVGPFVRGPVNELVLIETEAELQRTFGNPTSENAEYWYTVSNFLEYGGVCYVIRCDDASGGSQIMKNSVTNGTAVYIQNRDDFEEDYDNGASLAAYFAARTPGQFGNALGVSIIDSGADQEIKVGTTTIKNNAGAAVASTTRLATTGLPGTTTGTYEAVQAPAFIVPTAFASVATTSSSNVAALTGEQALAGVTTSTSRVLLTGQTDASENGIYVTASGAWARAADADAASDFEYAKSVVVTAGTLAGTFYYTGSDGPTIGSTALTFSGTDPVDASLALFQFVTLGNAANSGAATGYVAAIDSTTSTYTIAMASGTFVGAIGATSHLLTDGEEVTGNITAAEPLSTVSLYDQVTVSTNTVMNVLLNNQKYTLQQGITLFNWKAKPIAGDTATSTAGVTYAYVKSVNSWVAVFELKVGAVVSDTASNFFQIAIAEYWYDQKIAYGGIPWYRFASRPGTSLNALDRGATNDELNIIIYDATGEETGSQNNLIESYFGVSKFKGTFTAEGDKNYYLDVINNRSGYVYAGAAIPEIATGTLNDGRTAVGSQIAAGANADYIVSTSYAFTGGVNQLTASLGERQIAYNKFATENVSTLDYLLQGPAGANLAESTAIGNFLINIAEERRDCMCFLSPPRSFVVNQADSENVTNNVVLWANTLSSSSYAVFDSGYKYTFDRFNDLYRYIPLNGDTAGTLVFTSLEAEPYYSPAGVSRGQIRNVVKLPFNPSKSQRDILYSARVNPVVTFPGEGTVLFGDKTALGYSSAFDRINVRRLFLVVEREIAEISRVNLFEFNDDVTRTLFKNNVNPFLRDIQSKRGMFDFLVVCDSTNNTPDIIDRNEFVADIYIKPAKSINFITLNFIATKTGATFDESIGLFRGTTSTTGA